MNVCGLFCASLPAVLLYSNGFRTITSDALIVQTIKDEAIHVVLLSGVLTLAVDSMKNTIDKISEAGLREQVKILIGGAPVSEDAKELTGADDWAFNPQKTVERSRQWLEEYTA